LLAGGAAAAAAARARWTLVAEVSPFATAEIDVRAPGAQGSSHVRIRALMISRPDSGGQCRWDVVGTGGWTRIPSP